MARLLALVADLLAAGGLLGAVARQMAGDTAVVALVAVNAVACVRLVRCCCVVNKNGRELTRQVADAAARVAGLLVEATATVAGVVAAAIARALGAAAGNVAELTALSLLEYRRYSQRDE